MDPLQVELSNGQQVEVVKRFLHQYQEELKAVEVRLTALLTAQSESVLLARYLGEQPEVIALRPKPEEVAALEKRRQHLAVLIDRLEKVKPEEKAIKQLAPAERMRRY